MWTVQAPHCAMPQPYLVPVSPTFSRIAQSSGVSSSTSTVIDLPLIVRFAIAYPLLAQSIERAVGQCWPAIWNSSNQEYASAKGRKLMGRCYAAASLHDLHVRDGATVRRRKLIRLPSPAKPAPSASAIVAPL